MPPSADGGFLVGVQGSTVYLFDIFKYLSWNKVLLVS